MKEAQNLKVRRGQDLTVRFLCTGAAGASAATWYVAPLSSSAVGDRVTWDSGGNGITMLTVGQVLQVDVTLTRAQTEALSVGRLFHQLWVVDGVGNHVPNAEGTLTVADSLRN